MWRARGTAENRRLAAACAEEVLAELERAGLVRREGRRWVAVRSES